MTRLRVLRCGWCTSLCDSDLAFLEGAWGRSHGTCRHRLSMPGVTVSSLILPRARPREPGGAPDQSNGHHRRRPHQPRRCAGLAWPFSNTGVVSMQQRLCPDMRSRRRTAPGLARLKVLDLGGCKITNAGIVSLGGAKPREAPICPWRCELSHRLPLSWRAQPPRLS